MLEKNFEEEIRVKITVCGSKIGTVSKFIDKKLGGGGNNLQIDCSTQIFGNPLKIDGIDNVDFFEFLRRYRAGSIDAIIVSSSVGEMKISKEIVRKLKLNRVDKIAVYFDLFFVNNSLTWLDFEKYFFPYIEINLIDGCNLSCKGCSHFAPLYSKEEFYNLETFERDLKQFSRKCDLSAIRFVGGEPLLVKNIDEYINIVRKIFPVIAIDILTNGTLIPNLTPDLLKYLSRENVSFCISDYPPMEKSKDQIDKILNEYSISHQFIPKGTFRTILRKESGLSDPLTALKICGCKGSKILRNGKLYRCPIDALQPRYNEKFPDAPRKLPNSTWIDVYNPNFTEMIDLLDEPVEMCQYCVETPGQFEWRNLPNPNSESWSV